MAVSKRSIAGIKSLGDPVVKPTSTPLTEEQLQSFGSYGGTTDPKLKAAYLGKLGLVGVSQLMTDHPDITSKNGIINAQSDWKTSAISAMLMQARKLNLKTPTEIKANRAALIGSLDPRLQDAMKHPVFNQIHPNFFDTFNSVLKDQYAAEQTKKPLPPLVAALTKK